MLVSACCGLNGAKKLEPVGSASIVTSTDPFYADIRSTMRSKHSGVLFWPDELMIERLCDDDGEAGMPVPA